AVGSGRGRPLRVGLSVDGDVTAASEERARRGSGAEQRPLGVKGRGRRRGGRRGGGRRRCSEGQARGERSGRRRGTTDLRSTERRNDRAAERAPPRPGGGQTSSATPR